ncbi:MAG: hypothetical protein VX983_07965 [Actinomycetota bacterium]|nr:hypothetical protein [Acidimicrobiaceae bacterium]MED5542005.1 hypothetical protein [Actinomycetota bacterium]
MPAAAINSLASFSLTFRDTERFLLAQVRQPPPLLFTLWNEGEHLVPQIVHLHSHAALAPG